MKTKELIELLQKEDPSGEIEVCVGNADIHFVGGLPAYYDGRLQVLKRDKTNPYYNIIGAERRESGHKINIYTLSIYDAIWNDPDLPIDYSDLTNPEFYRKSDDKTREEVRQCNIDHELQYFTQHIKQRVEEQEGSFNEEIVKDFFEKHISPNDPFVVESGNSYVDTRNKQWLKEIDVECIGDEIILKKR